MTTVETDNNIKQPLSKSQKKRIKRKKPKQVSDDASAASSLPSQPDSTRETAATLKPAGGPLNPIEKLRMDLANEGYSLAEVEDSMDEMWNLNLPYDSFEEVLAFLKGKQQEDAQQGGAVIGHEAYTAKTASDDIAVSSQDGTDSITIPMTASDESVTPSKKEEDVGEVFLEAARTEDVVVEAAAPVIEGPVACAAAAVGSSAKKEFRIPAKLDVVIKLQLVANYENLHDAVFAISQWASKAKASEVSFFSIYALLNDLGLFP